jgi:uncharacterized membrane protein
MIDYIRLLLILFIIGIVGLVMILVGIVGLRGEVIDCSNVKYSKNITRTLEIIKYCTGNGGEGE